jgi:hypothetical protein
MRAQKYVFGNWKLVFWMMDLTHEEVMLEIKSIFPDTLDEEAVA